MVRGRALRLWRAGVGVSLGRLTGGHRYLKELVQYGICGLTSDSCSIARHSHSAMAVTLQELDLPRLETDQHEGSASSRKFASWESDVAGSG